MEWWKQAIFYEIYPKSFQDTTGSGTGDIQGVIQHLDDLKKLGIKALWLTPVFPSPMVDNGYDVSDYTDIHPDYGTMEDMKELIEEGKKRDIRIIVDLVFNHTSDQHPWFIESKKDRTNPKSDWYIWKDKEQITNWRSLFGGSAWTYCPERDQYYLHTFAKQQPDLNWENPQVRQALCEVAGFWKEQGVGGFRMDAVTYIKKPVYTNGTPDGLDGLVSIHTMTANTPGILDFLHEFKTKVTENTDLVTIGEAAGIEPDQMIDWIGNEGVFDMIFEFGHIDLDFCHEERWDAPYPFTLQDLKKALSASQQMTQTQGWLSLYFENHDKPRAVSHYFPEVKKTKEAARLLAVLLYTLRGTPFVYQGQELGLTNVAWPSIDHYNDVLSKAQYAHSVHQGATEKQALKGVHRYSRDNVRLPMPWDDTWAGGFTDGQPWLPVFPNYRNQNVRNQRQDRQSVFHTYVQLAQLRQKYPVLINGSFTLLACKDPNLFAYTRKNKQTEAVILLNWSEQEISYPLSWSLGKKILFDTYEHHQTGYLQPLEAVIMIKNDDLN